MSDQRPARVRVTSPQTARRGGTAQRSGARDLVAQSELGEIYLAGLLRAQLRQAFGTVAALVLTVGLLPLAFHLWPGLTERQVLGMPVSWVVLGGGVYPLILLLAARHVRAARRTEEAFTHVVEGS